MSVLCCIWQLGTFTAMQRRPATDVAQRTAEAESTRKTSDMSEILQTQSKMVTDAEDPSSLSQCEVCQSTSKVRAVCGSSARTDLCGGRPEMAVPTAILFTDAIATDRLLKSLDHHAQMELSGFTTPLIEGTFVQRFFTRKGTMSPSKKSLERDWSFIKLNCYATN